MCIKAGLVVPDLMCDCLDLHDPDASSYHLGFEYNCMRGIWDRNRQDVCHLLRRVKQTMDRARPGERTVIQFYCKSGRHRSFLRNFVVVPSMTSWHDDYGGKPPSRTIMEVRPHGIPTVEVRSHCRLAAQGLCRLAGQGPRRATGVPWGFLAHGRLFQDPRGSHIVLIGSPRGLLSVSSGSPKDLFRVCEGSW